jgi:hypothetical protein
MGHHPLPTVTVTPQLRTGHEENAPTLQPAAGILLSVNILEDRHNRFAVAVQIFKPGLGRFTIMFAVDLPVFFDDKWVLKPVKQIIRRHDPAAEKLRPIQLSSSVTSNA